jgi:predicted branched-subunit amino acid permease
MKGNDPDMTVRRKQQNRKSTPGVSGETSQNQDRQSLINQRGALILITGILIGIAAGILAHMAGAKPAEAVLTGGAACAGAIALLNTLIG